MISSNKRGIVLFFDVLLALPILCPRYKGGLPSTQVGLSQRELSLKKVRNGGFSPLAYVRYFIKVLYFDGYIYHVA